MIETSSFLDIPWPIDSWARSTPEEQGIDSVKLIDMLHAMQDRIKDIESLLLVRNGRLVLEAYRYPYNAATLHAIMSCTKSVTSAAIGIAIGQGKMKGINQRVAEFLPDYDIIDARAEKRKISIENLLTMSGGFEWIGGMFEMPTLRDLFQSQNWVRFVLDKPLSDPPGERFVYNSGGSHLLSAILQSAVGRKTEEYAAENIFRPLGINDWYWESDPQGITTGGHGLWLRPQDMAKFGYLYLNHGRWGNSRVVPKEWVSDSVRRQIVAGGTWLSDGYGYQWWIDNGGYYMAVGFGGQFIVVVPDRSLIMVTTSSLAPKDFSEPELLLNACILPASDSSCPLSSNQAAVTEMNDCIVELSRADCMPIPNLPQTAWRVSGIVYSRSEGTDATASGHQWKNVSFVFRPGERTALLLEDGKPCEIGLDGLYRTTDPFKDGANPPFPRGTLRMGRGHWTDENTFAIENFFLGEGMKYIDRIRFKADSLTWQTEDHGHALFCLKTTARRR